MQGFFSSLNFLNITAGLIAYTVALLVSTALVFITFRLNTILKKRSAQEAKLKEGHRSMAIALGATLLGQAILLRHVVFPVMAVVRDLFVQQGRTASLGLIVLQGSSFFVLISLLSIGSIWIGSFLFTKMTGKLEEQKEIEDDNIAVAIFYAFVIISIALIVNAGMEDLSRSLIPYGQTGILQIP
jgi:uncharacterized membrane protein YjfL (UPF0719 family)